MSSSPAPRALRLRSITRSAVLGHGSPARGGTRDGGAALAAAPARWAPSCGSPVPVTDSNHASPEGQMVSFLLFPALLRFLHSHAGKYKCATGVEPPGVFQ